MRSLTTLLIALSMSACATHTSINHLYPEYAGKTVVLTQQVYLLEVVTDNQINHPNYELSYRLPQYQYQGKIISLPVGSEIHIDGFQTHNRFTESGTEVEGWTVKDGRKIRFYRTLNHAYDGVKKMPSSSFPWKLKE